MTSPPRLWPTNIIGRFYLIYISLDTLNIARRRRGWIQRFLTLSLRSIATSPSNVSEWPKILSLLAYLKAFATPESYPQVIIRAFGVSFLRRSRGQHTGPLDQVSRACPRNPWTKMILFISDKLLHMRGGELALQLLRLHLHGEHGVPAEPCQKTLLVNLHLR